MKIKSLFLASSILFFGVMNTSVYANPGKMDKFTVNYETDLGHEKRTKDAIVSELLSEGYSLKDAEFYAKMDILSNQMTIKGVDFDSKDIKSYNKLYVKANQEEVREKALKKDLSAIKSLLEVNKALEHGEEDVKSAQRMNNSDNNKNSYVIKYSDGSSVEFSSTTTIDQTGEKVRTNESQTEISGPWEEAIAFVGEDTENFTSTANTTYTTNTVWKYFVGVSTAKVSDQLKWKHAAKSSKITYISDTGARSYAGVVKIAGSSLSNYQAEATEYGEYILQGYTSAEFVVDSSFSASYFGIGISISGGGSWMQYAITEVILFDPVTGDVGTYSFAGQFT